VDRVRIELAPDTGDPRFICVHHSEPMYRDRDSYQFVCPLGDSAIADHEIWAVAQWLMGATK
jgi:hypothetical protein